MSDYRCLTCGGGAAFMTSLGGQAQTWYCAEHAPLPRDPYDEDGYCGLCGNGRWKSHGLECKWQDAMDAKL
jgi:hypothetical protein